MKVLHICPPRLLDVATLPWEIHFTNTNYVLLLQNFNDSLAFSRIKLLKSIVTAPTVPSVLWRCWLGGRKRIRPVKNWVVGCWRGYLSGAVQTCISSSWCHCHSLSLASVKSRLVLPFWYRLTRVSRKRAVKRMCVCYCANIFSMLNADWWITTKTGPLSLGSNSHSTPTLGYALSLLKNCNRLAISNCSNKISVSEHYRIYHSALCTKLFVDCGSCRK